MSAYDPFQTCDSFFPLRQRVRNRMIEIAAIAVRQVRWVILKLSQAAVPRDLWVQMMATIANLKARAQDRDSQYHPASLWLRACRTQTPSYTQNPR